MESSSIVNQGRLTAHPLDPLAPEEIRAAAAIVRGHRPSLSRPLFTLIVLREPPKYIVASFVLGQHVVRRADVAVYERDGGATHEAIVNLATGRVERWTTLYDVRPPIMRADYGAAIAAVRRDGRMREGLRRRGLHDLGAVHFDLLSIGAFAPDARSTRRTAWAVPYLRVRSADNPYARPIENLRAAVDLDAERVFEVVDGEALPLPTLNGNFLEEQPGAPYRDDLQPLDITQPQGVSFDVSGHIITWQGWHLHVALHPVEGMVLSDVRYADRGRLRRILHRAALSEMVVPYGDPHDGFYWRSYFDAGEYGLGRCVSPLELGCDCLGAIRYLDAVLADSDGEPQIVRNAICVHEEDHSLLARHADPITGSSYVRRSRRLVLSFIATVGNYDYAFYWSLYQDARIELEVKVSGVVLTRGVSPKDEIRHAARLAPDLAAPFHQHLFNVRLDMAVDGDQNTVIERDIVASPRGAENPWGQGIEVKKFTVRRESEGRRRINPAASRTWQVVNAAVRNALGEPVGYELVPANGPVLLADPESAIGRRAGFACEHLWITRFKEDERHAAGEYPNQCVDTGGLPVWIQQDRALDGEDVVLWHTFGISHAGRLEDWPVMPVDRVGFTLRPVGFFDRSPALDVGPSPSGPCMRDASKPPRLEPRGCPEPRPSLRRASEGG